MRPDLNGALFTGFLTVENVAGKFCKKAGVEGGLRRPKEII